MITKELVTDYAKNVLKIDAIGFTKPVIPKQDLQNYQDYLAAKNYNDMLWMYTRQALREDPTLLMENTNSIVVLGFNYFNDTDKDNKDYKISDYANQQQDYHIWVKEVVAKLAEYINSFGNTTRHFVDSAPVLEKVLAKQTNIGWQGKHTCIVSKDFGSWLFLSVILTSANFEPDTPHKDYCGKCNKCIVACPTNALTPYRLDVKKCLSYLTIEHKNKFPTDLISQLNDKVFGCDECIKSCYFNKYQKPSSNANTNVNNNFPKDLQTFLAISPQEFKKVFKNTPLQRTGYNALLRNCLLALINAIPNITLNSKSIAVLQNLSTQPEETEIKDLSIQALKKANLWTN